MVDAVSALSIAMQNDLTQLNTVSKNVSNVNTVAYKRQVVVNQGVNFDDVYDAVLDAEGLSNSYLVTDHAQGSLKKTGNNSDIALDGNVFLRVLTEKGEFLTRRGTLDIDSSGRLILNSGEAVQGQSGEIFLSPEDFSIDAKGRIYQNDVFVAKLALVSPSDNIHLEHFGNGLFKTYDENRLVQGENYKVLQGYIEQSNVVMVDEMVRLTELTRHFEMSQRVVSSYDKAVSSAINIIGDF